MSTAATRTSETALRPPPSDAQVVAAKLQRKLIRCWQEGDELTTGELAKINKVAPRTISKWVDHTDARQRLRGRRIPGSQDRRVTVQSLLEFVRRDNADPTLSCKNPLVEKLLLWAAEMAGVNPDGQTAFGNTRVVMLSTNPQIEALGAGLLAGGASVPCYGHPVLIGLALQTTDLCAVIVDTGTTFSSGAKELVSALRKARPGLIVFVGFVVDEMRSEMPADLFEATVPFPFNQEGLLRALQTASEAGMEAIRRSAKG